MQSRPAPGPLPRARRLVALAGAVLLGGCAAPAESPDEIAERYARQESALIDEQTFEQARARSLLRRDARGRVTIESAPPLEIDPALTERWQFGTAPHPESGEPVCAALSGSGEPVPAPGEPTPRLLVLAGGAWVTSDVPLAPDRIESAVRIDSGLPVPLEVSSDGRVAALAIAHQVLLERLRAGNVATLRVMVATSSNAEASPDGGLERVDDPERPDESGASATAAGIAGDGDGADTAPVGPSRAVDRVVDLDGLPPMLDELARCAGGIDAPSGESS